MVCFFTLSLKVYYQILVNILVASDKFKGSLSQERVNEVLFHVLKDRFPHAQIDRVSLSDGGEGFLQTVSPALPLGQMVAEKVPDPLGRLVEAFYLWDEESKTAYIEFAQASGLGQLTEGEKDVLHTTSLGVGALMKSAISRKANRIYVGLGGSATNDAGMGIAHAFGYRFLDDRGRELYPCGKNLAKVSEICKPPQNLPKFEVYAIHDVFNTLYGREGAARVYARQKGGSIDDIELLDRGAISFSRHVKATFGFEDAHRIPGSGAAGGAGYGLHVFLGAQYLQGILFTLGLQGVTKKIGEKHYDLIISGEGRIDRQTLYGKLLSGLARCAHRAGVPCIAFCGEMRLSVEESQAMGITDVISINDAHRPLEWNLEHSKVLLEEKGVDYFRKFDVDQYR